MKAWNFLQRLMTVLPGALALACVLFNASAALAEDAVGTNGGPTVEFRGCSYYGNRNFAGARGDIHEGTSISYLGSAWNDSISSIACYVGEHGDYCYVTVFADRDFRGASIDFNPNTEYVGSGWNDRISSMKVTCSAPLPVPAEKIGSGMENNTDRPGSDYRHFTIYGLEVGNCQKACFAERQKCRAWSYVRAGVQATHAICYLKDTTPAPVPNKCCISDTVRSPQAEFSEMPRSVASPPARLPSDAVRQEAGAASRFAPALTQPRCLSGYVWREAGSSDFVCVLPESRLRAAAENTHAQFLVDPNGASGTESCVRGFVWREAFAGDHVCVTPETRDLVRQENAVAPSRTQHP